MKRSIRRWHEAEKRRIARRLVAAEGGRAPRRQGGPEFAGRGARYEVAKRVHATPYGGIAAIHALAWKVGLVQRPRSRSRCPRSADPGVHDHAIWASTITRSAQEAGLNRGGIQAESRHHQSTRSRSVPPGRANCTSTESPRTCRTTLVHREDKLPWRAQGGHLLSSINPRHTRENVSWVRAKLCRRELDSSQIPRSQAAS